MRGLASKFLIKIQKQKEPPGCLFTSTPPSNTTRITEDQKKEFLNVEVQQQKGNFLKNEKCKNSIAFSSMLRKLKDSG